MPAPDRLFIPFDEEVGGRFDCIGQYGEGNQFMAFVTGAYPADWSSGKYPPLYLRANWAKHKRWYAVLHRFDAEGNYLGTEARLGGTSEEQTDAIYRADDELTSMLAVLGPVTYCDIRVRLFGVEIDGYFFGLVYGKDADEEGDESDQNDIDGEDTDQDDTEYEHVILEPNDIMFHPPWDSGEYST